jgi:hypothetical protein
MQPKETSEIKITRKFKEFRSTSNRTTIKIKEIESSLTWRTKTFHKDSYKVQKQETFLGA